MAKLTGTDYIFSVARVRSVEKYMLSRERAERMIDAKTAEDAIRVLDECNYGYENESIKADEFEKLLSEEHKKSYDFIMSIAPKLSYFKMFLYPYDYHNLKVLMKAEYLGIDATELLVDTGTIDIKTLKNSINERDFLPLTEDMSKALNEIIDVFPKLNDPQIIDIILDKYCYDEMQKSAEETESRFIVDYVRMLIDTINIKTFVRLKKMDKSWDFFNKVFIKGGNINEQTFISNYNDSFDKFAEQISGYGFKEAFLEGTQYLEENGLFAVLEKLLDNKLIQFIKDAKFVSFDIDPLAAYLIAKDNEIKIARIILAGKLAGISPELIRERLRETYV
ncbi:MAG: V-type ATP synthase subunit C [Sedimentibacter sp.]